MLRYSFRAILLVVALSMAIDTLAQDSETFYKLANVYFRKYVHEGLVNYQYAKTNAKELNVLYKLVGDYDLGSASATEKKAFYTNAYNILIIYQIVQLYPINNPLDEKGFFDEKKFKIAGEMLSLDQLEKEKMIRELNEPRFHFVLACAAMSCPPLMNYAYTPANIESELTARTRQMLVNPSFVRVDTGGRKVTVSKIFDWYRSDFGDSLIEYINRYRRAKIPSDFQVEFFEYNWQLNERKG